MNPHVQPQRTHLIANLLATRGSAAGGPERGGPTRRGRRPPSTKKEILLVEDDRGIRTSLQEILEDEGYAVATAENGRVALEALRAGASPDLIVLDLRMPVMDGWQFRAGRPARCPIQMTTRRSWMLRLCSHRTWLQRWVSSSCNHILRRLEIMPLPWCGQRQKASPR